MQLWAIHNGIYRWCLHVKKINLLTQIWNLTSIFTNEQSIFHHLNFKDENLILIFTEPLIRPTSFPGGRAEVRLGLVMRNKRFRFQTQFLRLERRARSDSLNGRLRFESRLRFGRECATGHHGDGTWENGHLSRSPYLNVKCGLFLYPWAWGIQTGPFAACYTNFVPQIFQLFRFNTGESNSLLPQPKETEYEKREITKIGWDSEFSVPGAFELDHLFP